MERFPELPTTRLKLRQIQADDIPSLIKYVNNKKIADQILNIPHPYGEPDAVFRIGYVAQGFKAKTRVVFAMIWKETGELIGEISLNYRDAKGVAELGYWVGEPFWNQGVATEAIAAVLDFGFEKLGLHTVFATCYPANKASQKVLTKNGMAEEGSNGNVLQYILRKKAKSV